MKPEEFKKIATDNSGSLYGFAKETGAPKRTIYAWGTGERPIPAIVAYLMKLLKGKKK